MSAYAYYSSGDINREGFTSGYGRFRVGGLDRIEGSRLRDMFLPKLSREGQKALYRHHNFVRSQLKQYGVQFEEHKFVGNGTALMKAALQDGKCDRVPDYIANLEKHMHEEWLSQRSPEELSGQPDWVMQKYFLSDGQPDPTKTTTVIGIPLDQFSQYRSEQMIESAKKITGLYHMKAVGPETQVIFMGWNRAAVEETAGQHPTQEAKRLQDAKDEREDGRAKMHIEYLNAHLKKTADATPVGSYIVDSEYIEREWPDLGDDIRLDIHQTDTPGVFQADFDFGVVEGVMYLCSDRSTLEQYCTRAESDNQTDWDDSMDEEFEEETDNEDYILAKKNSALGVKRSAPSSKPTMGSKKYKVGQDQPLKYLLQLKCCETGEGVITFQPNDGTINFDDKSLVSFEGVASIPHMGQVSFFARKVSDVPCPSGKSWSDYSERLYEIARVRRWR